MYDHVLLVRQYRHGLGRISLEPPCGGAEPGESALDAARRELLEETGYGNARSMTLVASLSPNAANHANLDHTVLAEQVSAIGAPQHDPTEIQELARVPYREALNLALSGAIMQSTHVALVCAQEGNEPVNPLFLSESIKGGKVDRF